MNPTRFNVNGSTVEADVPDHNISLLDFLRDTLNFKGTKQGCGSGDCGACTVIVEDADGQTLAVNACITPAAAMQGKNIITIEGIANQKTLHPVQQALIDFHGSQCGFCTPGFVMALTAHSLLPDAPKKNKREDIIAAISGNLCRCTGYWPIIKAGMASCGVGEAAQLRHVRMWEPQGAHKKPHILENCSGSSDEGYQIAQNETMVAQRLEQRSPSDCSRSKIIAGATDEWVAVNQQLEQHETILDISRIPSLREITVRDGTIEIGACVTHSELFAYFTEAPYQSSAIRELLTRFGSPQIRNRGTIGGNICGGSPIADWSPLLLALDASVVLKSAGSSRLVHLSNFFLGYRQTSLRPDEYLASVQFNVPQDWSQLSFEKISKRYEDDISSVCAAIFLAHDGDVVQEARIAYGGIAPIPTRISALEAILKGQPLSGIDHGRIKVELGSIINPISDVRASANYRLQMAETMLIDRLALEQKTA